MKWQDTLGYEPGDTLYTLRIKAAERLKGATQVNNPRLARNILASWKQARLAMVSRPPSMKKSSSAVSRHHNAEVNAFVRAARSHGR